METAGTERRNSEQPIIVKEGWGKKAPPLGQFTGFKNWKSRYFALIQLRPNARVLLNKVPKKGITQMQNLHEYYLVYWESEDTTKTPVRAIPLLESYQVRMFPVYENVSNMISLSTNERIFFILAKNGEEMRSWHYHLSDVICKVKNKAEMNDRMAEMNGSVNADDVTDAERPREESHSEEIADDHRSSSSLRSDIIRMTADGDTLISPEHSEHYARWATQYDLRYVAPPLPFPRQFPGAPKLPLNVPEMNGLNDGARNNEITAMQDTLSSLDLSSSERPLSRAYTDGTHFLRSSNRKNAQMAREYNTVTAGCIPPSSNDHEDIYERIDGGVADAAEKCKGSYQVKSCGDVLTLSLTKVPSEPSSMSGSDLAEGGLTINHGHYEVTLKKK